MTTIQISEMVHNYYSPPHQCHWHLSFGAKVLCLSAQKNIKISPGHG